jgi:hypothetical protein
MVSDDGLKTKEDELRLQFRSYFRLDESLRDKVLQRIPDKV